MKCRIGQKSFANAPASERAIMVRCFEMDFCRPSRLSVVVAMATALICFSAAIRFFRKLLAVARVHGRSNRGCSMTRKEKSKAVEVGGGPAFTARQLKRIDRKVRERHERLRRKYKEIRGKKVDWLSHAIDDGWIYFTVRFMDKTACPVHSCAARLRRREEKPIARSFRSQ